MDDLSLLALSMFTIGFVAGCLFTYLVTRSVK